ncbi:fumarylacetoacetate hydrolase family protein [Raineyella fluvialis]|uniref:fumarylacetoacetate hydrolase family protein n=1 Tax=Raineyella fluvialis TaxID=2662261 RepID=UPI001E3DCEC7|nr:fumarylacetoacetate hydrolase family protein [Raineyella fluvialis]
MGRNYAEHAAEFARSGFDATQASTSSIPEAPVVFSKPYTSITGARAEIEPHAGLTSGLDYEAELGVVIGRGGRSIGRDQAMEHVWGYTIINDVTARDLQKLHKQWLIGKSLDTFCPMGPYVVTADEIGPGPLQVQCSVNGELRQDASTADLIFDIPTIIETLSAGITLVPGTSSPPAHLRAWGSDSNRRSSSSRVTRWRSPSRGWARCATGSGRRDERTEGPLRSPRGGPTAGNDPRPGRNHQLLRAHRGASGHDAPGDPL